MRIFGPDSLRQFDRATGEVFEKQSPVKTAHVKNPLVKRAGFFKRWLLKPVLVVGAATLMLHEYNKHIQNQWKAPDEINIETERQNILRHTLLMMLKRFFTQSQDTNYEKLIGTKKESHPVDFYLMQIAMLGKRIVMPAQLPQDKILSEEIESQLAMPLLRWRTNTRQRLILSNGDLVDRTEFCALRLFGIPFGSSRQQTVLKKYRNLTMAATLFGWRLQKLQSVDLVGDVRFLQRILGWFGGQSVPTDQHLALAQAEQQSLKLLLKIYNDVSP